MMQPFDQNSSDQQNERIEGIIKQKYFRNHKALNLDGLVSDWVNVLRYADWDILVELDLGDCKITDFNIFVLSETKWPNVKKLYIDHNLFGHRGMKILIETEWLKIQHIRLCYNKLGSLGAKFLSKMRMPELKELDICECMIGNEGTKHLIKAEWPNLQKMYVDINGIGTDGHLMLYHNSWKELASLQTSNFRMEKETINNIIQATDVLSLVPCDFQQTHFGQHWIQNKAIRSEVQKVFSNKWKNK